MAESSAVGSHGVPHLAGQACAVSQSRRTGTPRCPDRPKVWECRGHRVGDDTEPEPRNGSLGTLMVMHMTTLELPDGRILLTGPCGLARRPRRESFGQEPVTRAVTMLIPSSDLFADGGVSRPCLGPGKPPKLAQPPIYCNLVRPNVRCRPENPVPTG